jgi:hypothetical protein
LLLAELEREFTPPEIIERNVGIALFRDFSEIAIASGSRPRRC